MMEEFDAEKKSLGEKNMMIPHICGTCKEPILGPETNPPYKKAIGWYMVHGVPYCNKCHGLVIVDD